jgi:Protein of unknown function (DUF2971)
VRARRPPASGARPPRAAAFGGVIERRDVIPDYRFTKREGLLAHYTNASAAFEHILPLGTLRLSPYRLMRDPAENKDFLPSIGMRGDPPQAGQAIDDVYALLKTARDRMRVLSFTRDAEERGRFPGFDCCWARPRMWEQYADDHRGVCLLFDPAALKRAIAEQWPTDSTYMHDVDYTREGIVGARGRTFIDERMFEGKERAQAVADYIEARRDVLFFLKSDDFATEYEYRIVLAAGGDDYAHADYGDALVGVVLGERFPTWQRPGAVQECSKIEVKLGRMHWAQGRPHVLRLWSP